MDTIGEAHAIVSMIFQSDGNLGLYLIRYVAPFLQVISERRSGILSSQRHVLVIRGSATWGLHLVLHHGVIYFFPVDNAWKRYDQWLGLFRVAFSFSLFCEADDITFDQDMVAMGETGSIVTQVVCSGFVFLTAVHKEKPTLHEFKDIFMPLAHVLVYLGEPNFDPPQLSHRPSWTSS